MENKRFEITETAGSVKGFYVVVDRSLELAGVFVP